MNNWSNLLQALDDTFGFPNQIGSTVRKDRQFFDPTTNEHVFVLRYRVKVAPGANDKVPFEPPVITGEEMVGPAGFEPATKRL